MRYLSVCSGMEAASVAWHPLGWTPVGFSEIEPFPCAILKHRFPNVPNYGSLTEYQSWPLEPGAIDLLVGGTPCQSFSVAGLRKGLADPRGNLALTFLGLADKLKPRWIVWENVPGVLSSGGGRDFGSFLGALVELGYGFAYRVLDAQHFGVPQRRRRVFVVACLGDWRAAAEVLSLREGLRGYLETGNKKRKGVAADAGASVEAGGEGVATPFRKSKRACSTTDNETWVPADASNTLNNFDLGDTRTTHAVVQPIPIQDGREMEKKQNGLGIANQGDPAYTIDTTGAQAIAIQGTIIGRGENAGPQGTGATEGGPMFTLTKTDIHGVCHQMPGSVAPTIGASGPPYSRTGNERVEAEALAVTTSSPLHFDTYNQTTSDISFTLSCSASDANHTGTVFVPNMAVRRLTPNECYRLQGFPDNWGNIPWKGKPEGQAPDGPQYKAAGNSMAVPVMRWIGSRIAAVDATFSNPTNNA